MSIFTLAMPLYAAETALQNQLAKHSSPYLAMHGHDPVQWQEWNARTVAEARRTNKLIFVSSGYFSCHWCHVMQRESYQNKDVATLLNKYFIPVKVDRELDSALDTHLIDFVERTQGQAGWPLNVFITPQGYPLVGMTYVPPENFIQILQTLSHKWQDESGKLKELAHKASIELAQGEITKSSQLNPDLASGYMNIYVNQVFTNSDDLQGGFGQENKFPSVPKLKTLLTIQRHRPDPQIKQFLNTTLQHMASQGLWDQLGGGFFRYAVDPQWQVPHFEKMLYDNALLASLYFEAAEVLKEPAYRDVANRSLAFILNDMTTPVPAFAASLSAIDDKGIEGGYYLWDEKQLKALLTADEFTAVAQYWGVTGPADLEDGHHLAQTRSMQALATEWKLSEVVLQKRIASATQKMLKERARRHLPRDEKILAGWNGLTLTALVDGYRATGNETYKRSAAALVSYLHNTLWDSKRKGFWKAARGNTPLGEAALEDYAYIAQGLLAWWQLEKSEANRAFLHEVIEQAWQRFYGEQGWLLAQNMLLQYGAGQTVLRDDALPSPSAVLTETTYRYAVLRGNEKLRQQALRAMNVGHKQIQAEAFWFASQIHGIIVVQHEKIAR